MMGWNEFLYLLWRYISEGVWKSLSLVHVQNYLALLLRFIEGNVVALRELHRWKEYCTSH